MSQQGGQIIQARMLMRVDLCQETSAVDPSECPETVDTGKPTPVACCKNAHCVEPPPPLLLIYSLM